MTTDMTVGKPLNHLVKFAIPLMIGNIFQQLYNIVDTIVVGKCIGQNALAAVGTTGNVLFFMSALINGLCVGAGIVISQYYGRRNLVQLKRVIVALVDLLAFLTIIFTGISFILAPTILRIMRVPSNIIGDSILYLRIYSLFLFGMTSYNASATILRSVGDSKTPLLAMAASSITNIMCNLIFVIVFRWGVAGVAYGTVIAQILSASICIHRIVCSREEIGLVQLHFKPEWNIIAVIIKAGVPSAVQSSFISIGGMSVQGLVNTFGTDTMAAYTVAQRIDSVTIQIVVSLANALSVFTGQNIGSGDFKRIKEALHKTLILEMGFCVSLAILVLIFKRLLLSIFLDPVESANSINIGCGYMTIIGIAYIIAGIMNSYLNLIRGAGDVNASFLAGLTEISGRIAFAYLLVIPFGVTGIWLATPLSWGCGCIYSVVRYYSGRWKSKSFT